LLEIEIFRYKGVEENQFPTTLRQLIDNVEQGEEVQGKAYQFRIYHKFYSQYLEVSVHRILFSNEVCHSVVIRDISEIVELEQERKKEVYMHMLVSSISHEFNNPLNILLQNLNSASERSINL